jgi:hypothetical protein
MKRENLFLVFFLTFIGAQAFGKCQPSKMIKELNLHPQTAVSYGQVLGQAMAHSEKAGKPILLTAAIKKGNRNGQMLKRIQIYLKCEKCGGDSFTLWPDMFPALAAKATGGPIELWKSSKKITQSGGTAVAKGVFAGTVLKQIELEVDTKLPENPAMGAEKRKVTLDVPDLSPDAPCGECCD